MPILLGQVDGIILLLAIGKSTYRLGAIRENRPEGGPQASTRRICGSLGTKGHAAKRLPAPRGYKKGVTRLGVTRVSGYDREDYKIHRLTLTSLASRRPGRNCQS